jgi:hypothetical protein
MSLHEVIALQRQRLGAGQVDRARVVHAHVDAAEPLDRVGDGRRHRVLVADVADDRERRPARLLDLRRGGEHRAREARVRLGRLGDQRDVGAVAGGAQRNRQPDAAAAAGDEQRLACQ